MSESGQIHSGEQATDERDATQPATGLDEILSALSKERRRVLLDVLDDGGGGTFAEVVARVSGEIYGDDYDRKERQRVYVSLYQNHVPRLADAGIVVFEGTGDDDRIYTGTAFPETKDALDGLRRSVNGSREENSPRFRTLRDLL